MDESARCERSLMHPYTGVPVQQSDTGRLPPEWFIGEQVCGEQLADSAELRRGSAGTDQYAVDAAH